MLSYQALCKVLRMLYFFWSNPYVVSIISLVYTWGNWLRLKWRNLPKIITGRDAISIQDAVLKQSRTVLVQISPDLHFVPLFFQKISGFQSQVPSFQGTFVNVWKFLLFVRTRDCSCPLLVKAKDAIKHLKMHRTTPITKNYPAQSINSAKIKKSCSKAMSIFFFSQKLQRLWWTTRLSPQRNAHMYKILHMVLKGSWKD